MQRWVSTVNVCRFCVCLLGRVITVYVRMFCQWCVHAMSCCCKGFVEDYRNLLELVCEACNVRLGSPVVEAWELNQCI